MPKQSGDKVTRAAMRILEEAAAAAEPPEDPKEIDDAVNSDAIAQIEEMIENCNLNNAIVRVMRRAPLEPKAAFVCEMAAREFEFETVKKLYGGGEYTFVLCSPDGKYIKRRTVSIDSRFKGELDREVERRREREVSDNAPLRVGSSDNESSLTLFRTMMEKQSEDNRFLLTAMMEANRSQVSTMTAAFGAMASAGGARSGGLDLGAIMPLLLALLDKGGKGQSPMAALGDMMEAMQKLQEMTGGARTENNSPWDKLLSGVPNVLNSLANRLNQNPVRQERVVMPVQEGGAAADLPAAPVQHQAPAAAPVSAAPADTKTALGRIMELAIDAARRPGSDPDLYVDLLFAHLDEHSLPLLESVLTGPEWFEQMFAQLPDGPALKPWLTKLRNAVLEEIKNVNESAEFKGNGAAEPGGGDPPGVQGAGHP